MSNINTEYICINCNKNQLEYEPQSAITGIMLAMKDASNRALANRANREGLCVECQLNYENNLRIIRLKIEEHVDLIYTSMLKSISAKEVILNGNLTAILTNYDRKIITEIKINSKGFASC